MTDMKLDRKTAAPVITRERIGVSLMFLMNGFYVGAWAPKIPEFAERLSLNETRLGLMILVFGLGSLVFMPIAGSQIPRLGSMKVTRIASIMLTPLLILLSIVSEVWEAAIVIFLFGGLIGAMDVAMNANAVATERGMRRAIMSSCHAFWSLGGLIGSATGGVLIAHLGVLGHSIAATVGGAIVLVIGLPMLLSDLPEKSETAPKRGLPLTPLPWLIGVVALFSMVPEGAVIDWSALYLRNELNASLSLSGFAFAAFSMTMAAMRFAGDVVRDRLGAVLTMRLCGIIAIIGLVIAGLAPSPYVAIPGFALAGIGISNMVPIAFSAAGNLPGMAPGVALSVVTVMGYSGILVAPSVIGFVANHVGLGVVYLTLPGLLLVVLLLSSLARYAEQDHAAAK